MKAALHNGAGVMEVRSIPVPEVGPREVLVRVKASGICGSDLNLYGTNKTPETIPGGHEIAGEVVEVGENVRGVKAGDRVALEGIGEGRACGECYFCRTGQYVNCPNRQPSSGGGFAQYMKRLARACHRLPDSFSWEEGALVEPFAVGVHGVRFGGMKGGDTVVVLGAGTIGLMSVAAARCLGAGRVFATAMHPHQKEMALRLGADAVFLPEGAELGETVDGATGGVGADVVIETVGRRSPVTVQQAIEITRKQGRIVIMGVFHHGPLSVDFFKLLLKEHLVVFANCYSILDGRHDFDVAIDLMASGRASLKQLVTHRLPLDRIQEAFGVAQDKTSGSIKVMLFP
jgi:2-desacetyl-2-hydroxyethyl bacteriochlorophyllide A dehydrogenase